MVEAILMMGLFSQTFAGLLCFARTVAKDRRDGRPNIKLCGYTKNGNPNREIEHGFPHT